MVIMRQVEVGGNLGRGRGGGRVGPARAEGKSAERAAVTERRGGPTHGGKDFFGAVEAA
jgi:hypothetical protein